ncbi:MAG: zf-HC2 domain-containing protein, partial [Myxococcales bacterium]|nr:zf-HC2 domain-containing protein [Myxococcales bacterium]
MTAAAPLCLDDAVVLAMLEGRLDAESLEEVDAHVDTCPACRELVLGAARGMGEVRPSRGDRLGRYLVLGELGRGGFGTVLEVYDPELDRRVA